MCEHPYRGWYAPANESSYTISPFHWGGFDVADVQVSVVLRDRWEGQDWEYVSEHLHTQVNVWDGGSTPGAAPPAGTS